MSEWTDEQAIAAYVAASGGDQLHLPPESRHTAYENMLLTGRALLTLERERDEALKAARDNFTLCWDWQLRAEKAEAEVARMRPVVEAAVHWAEQWSRDADNKALEAAVDAYRAGGGK